MQKGETWSKFCSGKIRRCWHNANSKSWMWKYLHVVFYLLLISEGFIYLDWNYDTLSKWSIYNFETFKHIIYLHILKWLELILVDSFAINLSTWHWFYAAPKSKFTLRINSNWQWRAFIYCISISWRRGWNMVCVIYIMISINDGIIIFTKASFLRPSVSNDFYRLCVCHRYSKSTFVIH